MEVQTWLHSWAVSWGWAAEKTAGRRSDKRLALEQRACISMHLYPSRLTPPSDTPPLVYVRVREKLYERWQWASRVFTCNTCN